MRAGQVGPWQEWCVHVPRGRQQARIAQPGAALQQGTRHAHIRMLGHRRHRRRQRAGHWAQFTGQAKLPRNSYCSSDCGSTWPLAARMPSAIARS